jgi:S-DNA-T family DNA segregation ATPase FtsK/SpoIIIE
MPRKKKNKKELREEAEMEKPAGTLAGDVKRSAVAVLLFALAALSVLGFLGSGGTFGDALNKSIAGIVGWGKLIFPFFLIAAGIVMLLRKSLSFYIIKLAGLLVMFLSLVALFHWFYASDKMLAAATDGQGGGYVGYAIDYLLGQYLGSAGNLIAILAFFFVGAIVAFDFSIAGTVSKLRKGEELEGEEIPHAPEENIPASVPLAEVKIAPVSPSTSEDLEVEKNIGKIEFVDGPDRFSDKEPDSDDRVPEIAAGNFAGRNSRSVRPREKNSAAAKNKKKARWIYPPFDLLEKSTGTPEGGDTEKNFAIIEKTLKDFGIDVERGAFKTGPAVTQYSFRPAVGVKIAKILSLQNDLALALAAHPIRIEAPIPKQSLIGIEIPNTDKVTVCLRDMLDKAEFRKRNPGLTLALGEDVSGEGVIADLAKMPHLMIAGATGTGKSVAINSVIVALLYQNSPEDLKFIMVDPKRVELSLYNGIPHLLTDVIVENSKVVNTLRWAVSEMERRYRLLQDSGSRDLESYREKKQRGETIRHVDPETNETSEEELKDLPYIVIVIDELADLMGSHGKEVEGAIVRLAQMARAVGIHLIVSTQRPSVEVITGLIKANITTRIAFQVATQIDSRTILDMGGAEKLLGRGDMLYLSASSPKPQRIQGAFVSETEVKRVVDFIKAQNDKFDEKADETPDIAQNAQREILEYNNNGGAEADDKLLAAAKEEITRSKKASASLLQRRLRIGYARAARLLDILEEKGIVGPADGAKPREIYGLTDDAGATNYDDTVDDQKKRDKWEL